MSPADDPMPTAAPPGSGRAPRRPFRIELTESEFARLAQIAEAEGASAEEVLQGIVRDGLRTAHDLAGRLEGPPDLAADPAHLAGFGT